MSATPRRILLADCDAMFVAVARLVDPEERERHASWWSAAAPTVAASSAPPPTRRAPSDSTPACRSPAPRGSVPTPPPSFPSRERSAGSSTRKSRCARRWAPMCKRRASMSSIWICLVRRASIAENRWPPLRRGQDAVHRQTGLTVSIGGGTNRLVAKLAAERAKPRPGTGATGVLIVPRVMKPVSSPSSRSPTFGIGPRLQATSSPCSGHGARCASSGRAEASSSGSGAGADAGYSRGFGDGEGTPSNHTRKPSP